LYNYAPVVGIEMYSNDVVVRRAGDAPDTHDLTRDVVTEFSKASRQRLAFVAANTSVEFTTMITLTYPGEYPTDGEKVKRDRRAFQDWLRRDQGNPEYLWFLEFQKRGAPHYHILTDQLWPKTRLDEKALRFRVAATWYRQVGSGDPRHLAAGTRTEKLRTARGGACYAVKYSMKMQQKLVPADYQNVGRFWGHSRGVTPVPEICLRCTEDDIRGVLDGWDYAPADDHHVWKILYNTREVFDAFLDPDLQLDKDPDPGYTAAEQQIQNTSAGRCQQEGNDHG